MKKIKVLRIITRLNTGGPSLHVIYLEKGLKNYHYQSILFTGKTEENEGSFLEFAQKEGINLQFEPHLKRKISPFDDLIAFFKIFRLIQKHRPHIVHTHMSKAGLLGRIAAFLNGVPLIFHTFHGHVFHGYFSKLKSRLYIYLERILGHLSTKLITLSPYLVDELSEKYQIASKDKFALIPLGFTFENLNVTKTKEEVRKDFFTPIDAIVITIVARLVPIKNHSFLLKVFAKLRERLPEENLVLWIVGDGEEREKLEKLAQELKIESWVYFLGWQMELGNIYLASDLIVLTSKNEGLPVTLIEAMAMGKKILSSKVGGVVDLIEEGKHGYLFTSENEDDFLEKAIKMIKKKDFNLSDKEKRIIRKKYSANRLIKDIDNLYQAELRKKEAFLK